ncbi:MAG: P-loop NTPase, partial [Corynebacterium sp.]|nr:P-loop NTPase [Corynebacterium sp.]
GTTVPVLGKVPLDPELRKCGDDGTPIAISAPDSATGKAIHEIVDKLAVRTQSLAGKQLNLGVKR